MQLQNFPITCAFNSDRRMAHYSELFTKCDRDKDLRLNIEVCFHQQLYIYTYTSMAFCTIGSEGRPDQGSPFSH